MIGMPAALMGKDANHRGSGLPAHRKTRFARLDHDILSSAAYRALTPNGRALLTEFAMMYNQRNNGELFLSVRDAAARMGVADLTAASKAFAELMQMGFIDLTDGHSFSSVPDRQSKARCWRVTWEAAPGRPASHDYRSADVLGGPAFRRAKAGRLALERYHAGKAGGPKSSTRNAFLVAETNTLAWKQPAHRSVAVMDSDTGKTKRPLVSVETDCSGNRHTSSIATTGAASTHGPGQYDAARSDRINAVPAIPAPQIDALREEVRSYLDTAGLGALTALAAAAGMSKSVLSKFKDGRGLPSAHFIPLRMALARHNQGERARV